LYVTIFFYLIFFLFSLILKLYLLKVFASQTLSKSNSLWIVSDLGQKNNSNPIIYGKSEVYLKNKGIGEYIVLSKQYKSPSTGNKEGTVRLIYLII
jgi:hypothetical protein